MEEARRQEICKKEEMATVGQVKENRDLDSCWRAEAMIAL